LSGQKNAEETLADYVEKMGPELGELFRAESDELTWIHWRWNQFRVLFGEKPSRIDLLNEAAPFFFQVVHDVLFEGTLLAIASFVGPPKSTGKSNLTIERLPPMLGDTSLRNEVQVLIAQAKASAAFAIDWRNRHIAHRDLSLILGKPTPILEVATREKVEAALLAFRNVLNRIEVEYCNAETAYAFKPSPWGAENLLHVIRDGLLRESDRQARWDRGELHDDDLTPAEEV
jgi:hypothetical protein